MKRKEKKVSQQQIWAKLTGDQPIQLLFSSFLKNKTSLDPINKHLKFSILYNFYYFPFDLFILLSLKEIKVLKSLNS